MKDSVTKRRFLSVVSNNGIYVAYISWRAAFHSRVDSRNNKVAEMGNKKPVRDPRSDVVSSFTSRSTRFQGCRLVVDVLFGKKKWNEDGKPRGDRIRSTYRVPALLHDIRYIGTILFCSPIQRIANSYRTFLVFPSIPKEYIPRVSRFPLSARSKNQEAR